SPTATTPTNSVVRAPTSSWLTTSRPNVSVPSQWAGPTGASRAVGATSTGSYGVQTNETSAAATTSPTSAPPTTSVGGPIRPRVPAAVTPPSAAGGRARCRPRPPGS